MFTLKGYQQQALHWLDQYFREVSRLQDADTAFYQITQHTHGRRIGYSDIGERLGLAELRGLPYVCVRIPTGGGKTLVACHAVPLAFRSLLQIEQGVVLWLVPSNAILSQTLAALKDRGHPYRQALEAAVGSVAVMDVGEALYLSRSTLDTATVVIVATIQSFRVEDTTGRKVYEDNGALMDLFSGVPEEVAAGLERFENEVPKRSLANLLRLRRPVVIVDEAHNARTGLSFETLARLRPSCIIEFTATPDHQAQPSNVLFSASAAELKAEDMIKLPLELAVQSDWTRALDSAVAQRNALEREAKLEEAETGEYLRPIVLVQAQPTYKDRDSITVDTIERYLCDELRVPKEQVKRATGSDWELDGIDLFAEDCPVRFIITVQALREGWDCPFAYVLCTVSNVATTTAVEQLVGRVLRMPQTRRKKRDALNRAYVFASSSSFAETLRGLQDALVQNGFERIEAETLIQAAAPTAVQGDFGPLFMQPTGISIRVRLDEEPDTARLPEGITFDRESSTLTIGPSVTAEERERFVATLPERARNTVAAAVESATKTPSERGERFVVPYLAVKQGELFEPFEDTHLAEVPWSLSDMEATLPAYTPSSQQGQRMGLDISAQGRVVAQEVAFVPELQRQLAFFAQDYGWTEAELVRWLDRQLHAPDLGQDERQLFLTRLILHLTGEQGVPLNTLVRDRFALRRAVAERLDEHRKAARKQAHQLFLDGTGPGELVVSPDVVFAFPPEAVYNQLYAGRFSFPKHYYPVIGTLNGEEEACALEIDRLDEVEYWVRNPVHPRYGFWLQTSSDRFYPDFVCKLKDGRIFVVEYKGADRYDNPEEREKRVLGELWAARSDGRCLFVMPPPGRLDILRTVVSP